MDPKSFSEFQDSLLKMNEDQLGQCLEANEKIRDIANRKICHIKIRLQDLKILRKEKERSEMEKIKKEKMKEKEDEKRSGTWRRKRTPFLRCT